MVITSIIAVLIGILLPALSAARNAGRAAQCLTNVRSLAELDAIWLTDSNNIFPLRPSGAVGGGGVRGAFFGSQLMLRHDQRDLRSLACPDDTDPTRLYLMGGTNGGNTTTTSTSATSPHGENIHLNIAATSTGWPPRTPPRPA